ncbi:MAG: hypothetical protein GXP40_06525 [Chloroflexi bacterium]|nr:hypothetical protein [Chloroflexota bacterium]
MPLLTIFSAPKPFTDPHIATIQRNAIRSWLHLPDVDVILLGEEPGLADDAARELGVTHYPEVVRNANGTPLISSMFALARQHSDSPLLCIVNADILLMSDFVEAAKQVVAQRERFVMLGRRWDLDVTEPLDFSGDWESLLREQARRDGNLHKPAGSDYFVFPRACYTDIPDFAIGRAGWDNWMIYKARAEKWAVIDATHDVMIVHQNHDYSHLPGGRPHYDMPETDENVRMAGGSAVTRYTIIDANRQLRDGKILRPRPTRGRFLRGIEQFLRKLLFFLPEAMLEKIVRPQRWIKKVKKIFG